jgi:hypothetical protein
MGVVAATAAGPAAGRQVSSKDTSTRVLRFKTRSPATAAGNRY